LTSESIPSIPFSAVAWPTGILQFELRGPLLIAQHEARVQNL
jgi:hypothetical protein